MRYSIAAGIIHYRTAMEHRDYYEILEVEREVTPQQIKEAYRRLAFQYHPDRNEGDGAALERMKSINEAYAVLSDPEKRGRYDNIRNVYGQSAYDHFREGYSEEDIFRGSDIGKIFEEMARGFGVRGFEETFKAAYGSGYRTFQFGNGGGFGRGFIFTGFPQGYRAQGQVHNNGGLFSGVFGRLIKFALKKTIGFEPPQPGKDRHESLLLTTAQAVEGTKIHYADQGTREVIITIPAGVKHGQTIRLRGLGSKGKGGAVPGDLYLKVTVKKPLSEKIRDLIRG